MKKIRMVNLTFCYQYWYGV